MRACIVVKLEAGGFGSGLLHLWETVGSRGLPRPPQVNDKRGISADIVPVGS